jgi:hypothetical protein
MEARPQLQPERVSQRPRADCSSCSDANAQVPVHIAQWQASGIFRSAPTREKPPTNGVMIALRSRQRYSRRGVDASRLGSDHADKAPGIPVATGFTQCLHCLCAAALRSSGRQDAGDQAPCGYCACLVVKPRGAGGEVASRCCRAREHPFAVPVIMHDGARAAVCRAPLHGWNQYVRSQASG